MTGLQPYSPTSQALFVFICSGTKDEDSPRVAQYDPGNSIVNVLPSIRQQIVDHRRKAYNLV